MFWRLIRSNPWAAASILITVGDALLIFAAILYLKAGDLGMEPQLSRARSLVGAWGGLSVLFSSMTALVGISKDRSRVFAILALALSLASLFFYALQD